MLRQTFEVLSKKVGFSIPPELAEQLDALHIEEADAAKFAALMNEDEARSNVGLFESFKDKVSKERDRSLNQTFGNAITSEAYFLDESEKEELGKIEKNQDRIKYLIQKAREAKKDQGADVAGLNAIIETLKKEKETVIETYNSTHIPKESVDVFRSQNESLKKGFLKAQIEKIAVKSNLLSEDMLKSPILADQIKLTVDTYVRNKAFGDAKAVLLFDEETSEYVVRNKDNKDITLTFESKLVTMEDIVLGAINEYLPVKKAEEPSGRFVVDPVRKGTGNPLSMFNR